jgi:hypothetical protein
MRKIDVVSAVAALIVLMLLVGQGGCGWQRSTDSISAGSSEMAAPQIDSSHEMARSASAEDAEMAGDVDLSKADGSPGQVTRRIIKTGDVSIEVTDLPATVDQISRLAEEAGGYVSGSRVYETGEGRRSGSVEVRVPADKFTVTFRSLREIGKAVSYSEDASDVTEECIDLEARISNQKAEEKSLLALLQRKGELSDILEIQREIFRVRGEIERLEGRLRYLKDQVSLSTISVTVQELGAVGLAERGPWRLAYHLRTAWVALARMVESLVYAVVYAFIAGAVFWIPLVLLILWIRRRRRTREARRT